MYHENRADKLGAVVFLLVPSIMCTIYSVLLYLLNNVLNL